MTRRYQIRNKRLALAVEDEYTLSGYKRLQALRRRDSRFPQRPIRDVLQAFPSRLPVGIPFETR